MTDTIDTILDKLTYEERCVVGLWVHDVAEKHVCHLDDCRNVQHDVLEKFRGEDGGLW